MYLKNLLEDNQQEMMKKNLLEEIDAEKIVIGAVDQENQIKK